jgi:hypothetical protein
MTKQKAPSFPFYYRDWLHGVRHYSNDEKVEYLELLCEQADADTGSIPEKIFNQLIKTDTVRENFDHDSHGWFNVRMRDVLLKRDKFKQSRLDNLKGNPQVEPHMDDHVEKEKEKEKGIRKPKAKKEIAKVETQPLVYPWTDEVFLNRWAAWKEYKKAEHKFNYKSPKTEQAGLKELAELSNGNLEVALAMMQKSMANGWKGFFKLDTGNQPNNPAEAADYMNRLKSAMK